MSSNEPSALLYPWDTAQISFAAQKMNVTAKGGDEGEEMQINPLP